MKLMLKCSECYCKCKHRDVVDLAIFAVVVVIVMLAMAAGYNSVVPAYQ